MLNVTLPRLKRANISTTFYAISGDSLTHANGTYRFLHAALQNIDALRTEMAASQGQMKLILHREDLPAAPTPDTVHFVLSFEGGKPLEGRLENLRNFYCLGLRAMQITWNLRNELADGVKEERTGGGLTNFGEAVVREMERLGMVIDLAHISRAGWFDVLDVASGPVCCSHSTARRFITTSAPSTTSRSRLWLQTGGVLGVNAIATMVAKEPTLDKLVDHICHIADLVGIDHVGLGLGFRQGRWSALSGGRDFRRRREQAHPGIRERGRLINITECLLKRGFRKDDVSESAGRQFSSRAAGGAQAARSHDRIARRSRSGVRRRGVKSNMPDLRLSLALNDYVHTADIANGRVRAPGIDLTIVSLPFESVAMRFGANLEFDVAEYSLANYCAHLAEPRPSPMVALPVFTSRVFRHSSIYVNEASNIADAGDLAGRTVGIPQWSQTATVYVRGYLTHDAGVPLRSIRWVQAGVDQPGRRDGVQSYLPEGVTVTPRPDRTLSDLLASGEIDAAISARPPQCFMQGAPGVRRLFPDFRQEEERYFARTGIFPIMHVIAMRRPVYEANPWIARNLLDAFETAKRAGLARLRDIQTSHLPSAWATDEMERVHKLLFPDGDRWPYGLEPNRPTLEAFLAYAHEQGVTRRRLSCEELFPKEVSFEVRISTRARWGQLLIDSATGA